MCRWLIKKIEEYINKHFSSENDKTFLTINLTCYVFLALLILPLTYDRIIAEITTPIRCAIADDTVKVLMPVEEWQKQRGIKKLRPIKDYAEYRKLSNSIYNSLTPSEKKLVPSVININGKEFKFIEGYIYSGVILYSRKTSYLNIFNNYSYLVYDVFLQKTILSINSVSGQYWTLMGPGSELIFCDRPDNLDKLFNILYQYSF
ncbi:hypothetical protein [Gallibacterium anatis]|uniref:Uncharacterized protein n=1 Tax=Gallibacterium anatis TaxID=750 RepID=A0A1A7P707_9PAST|nr:hypothetical protein [Gallibacterium anatis]OBW98252.1 hypothetical protein QV03_07645 [Gallibacterium anatis]